MEKLTLAPVLNFGGPPLSATGTVELGSSIESAAPLRLNAEPGHVEPRRAQPLTVAAAMLELLQQHGVDHVFGIPGGPISPLFDAAIDTNLKVVTSQHETMAAYEAIGYAQATGRPGVLLVTSGPGILNAITGIAAAQLNEVPLLVLVGDVATGSAGRGALQDSGPSGLDIERMLQPVTRMAEGVLHARRALPTLEQALRLIMGHPRGAAVLRLPIDVTRHPAVGGFGGHAQAAPAQAPDLTLEAAAEVATLLARAERPLLLAGVGARSAAAGEAIRRLAEAANCPVATGLDAKGILSEHHPLSLGVFGVGGGNSAAAYLSQSVDLLITVGARFDDTTTLNYSPLIERIPSLVQLDHDRSRLGRAFQAQVTAHCELRPALDRIRELLPAEDPDQPEALARRRLRDENLRALARSAGAASSSGAGASGERGQGPHDPRTVARLLEEAAGPEAVFACDIGNHMLFTAQGVMTDHAARFFVDLGLGGMGSGLGNAIGLQLGHGRRRRVVAVIGDGGLLMAGNELATCASWKVPLLVVVFNDGQLGMVKHGSAAVYGRSFPCDCPHLDVVSYARSLGAEALRVETLRDLRSAFARRLAGPLVLDVPIRPEVRPGNPRDEGLDSTSKNGN